MIQREFEKAFRILVPMLSEIAAPDGFLALSVGENTMVTEVF